MAKKKKKNRTLLLLVFIMIGMAGAYTGVTKWNAAKEAEKSREAEAKTIVSVDTEKAEKITFTNEAGTVTLVRKNDTWNNEKDENFPVNQTYVTGMLSALADIRATKTVSEEAEDVSQYGLDQPALTVQVTLEDGTAETITLGMEVPVAGGYYALTGESTSVYTIDTAFYDTFQYSEKQMIQIEETPEITASNITHLTVNAGKEGANFEAVYDTEGTGASDYFLWDIKQPYKTEVSGDPTAIGTLLENYSSFTYTECEDYNSENPSEYGISKDGKSVSIAYYVTADGAEADASQDTKKTKTGKNYTLYIGNTNENGDYYVQPSGSKAVYLMQASDVESILTLNAFDYVNKTIISDSIEDITAIDLKVEKESHHLTVTKKGTYEMDGKEISSEDFNTAYSSLVGIQRSKERDSETVPGETPYISLTVHTSSAEKTVEFLPYDGNNFYLVSEGGTGYFLVEKQAVDSMVAAFL